MVMSRYANPKLATLGLAGRVLTEYSCDWTYFSSCAAHAAALDAPRAVPVLNLLSAVDPFFSSGTVPTASLARDTARALYAYDSAWAPADGPHSSVASRVASHPNGFGGPLTGNCASRMRAQGAPGVALTLDEPYHGGYAFAAATINHLLASFVHNTTASASARSVLTYDGLAVPSSMCQNTSSQQGVLSAAICSGFEAVITPLPVGSYPSTACDWKAQWVRPMLAVPPESTDACARSA